jgi:Acyltransferase
VTTTHPIGVEDGAMTHPVELPELPSERSLDRMVSLLAPLQRICQPRIYGLENLPTDGCLLVGNHTIYGFLDLPFMMAEVWKRRRLVIRGLGEHAHYAVPVWVISWRRAGWSAARETTSAP